MSIINRGIKASRNEGREAMKAMNYDNSNYNKIKQL